MSITEPLTSENENDSRDLIQDTNRKHDPQEVASDGKFVATFKTFCNSSLTTLEQMTQKMFKLKFAMVTMTWNRLLVLDL